MCIRKEHIDLITKVAGALGDLNEQVVYVGGAVVSLYVTDQAAPDVCPTDNVDIILEVTSVGKPEALREKLRKKDLLNLPWFQFLTRIKPNFRAHPETWNIATFYVLNLAAFAA